MAIYYKNVIKFRKEQLAPSSGIQDNHEIKIRSITFKIIKLTTSLLLLIYIDGCN